MPTELAGAREAFEGRTGGRRCGWRERSSHCPKCQSYMARRNLRRIM